MVNGRASDSEIITPPKGEEPLALRPFGGLRHRVGTGSTSTLGESIYSPDPKLDPI